MPIMIQISELSLSDEEKRPIFRELNFRLNRGEWASVSGADGEGKRLLLELLCAHVRPDHGQILVDDRNILRISDDKLRLMKRRLGLVLRSEYEYKPRTISDYLEFKLRALDVEPDALEDRAMYALDLVGLAEQGNQTPLDLSPVECKLFELALALSHEPVLLFLDEPLSGFGKDRERDRFLDVLEKIHLRKRLTTLMTTAPKDRVPDRFPVIQYELTGGRLKKRSEPETSAAPVSATEGRYE